MDPTLHTSDRPLPEPDIVTAGFWTSVAEGRLAVQKCDACSVLQHPPAFVCMTCGSTQWHYADVSGRGTIYSFTVVHTARHRAFRHAVPFGIAMIQLEEDPSMFLLANYQSAEVEGMVIGAQVEFWSDAVRDGISIPQFRIVTSGATV